MLLFFLAYVIVTRTNQKTLIVFRIRMGRPSCGSTVFLILLGEAVAARCCRRGTPWILRPPTEYPHLGKYYSRSGVAIGPETLIDCIQQRSRHARQARAGVVEAGLERPTVWGE